MEKRCFDCGETKSVECFHRSWSKYGGRLRRVGRCKDCQRVYSKRYRAENRATILRKKAVYAAEHVIENQAWKLNSRARAFGADERISVAEIIALRDAFAGDCAYCSQRGPEFDHLTPLARGGTNIIENVVPSCAVCNASKRDRTPLEWFLMRDRGARIWCCGCGGVFERPRFHANASRCKDCTRTRRRSIVWRSVA